ncbi:MAG: GldG family protein [Nitrospiria bacterium]
MEVRKTIPAIVGFAGVLFGLAGLFVYLIWGKPVWLYTTLELLAVLHLSVFLVTHFEMLKDFSTRRSTKFGTNSALMIILFVAILSIINFIFARHEVRIDLSDMGVFSLSPQTENILKNLEKEVKITAFFAEQSKVKGRANDLFDNYRKQTNKVKLDIIDPDKKPAIAKQYGITEYDTVVLESGDQSATARAITEEALTSALIRVSRGTRKNIYFVEGHGENSIDDTDRDGYSFLKETLEKQGFGVKKLHLLSAKEVPKDADVVVLAGAQRPLADEEKNALNDYLGKGGRLFLLIDPMVKANLGPFLSKWGIILEEDIILDATSGLGGAIPIVNPGSYPPHKITQQFNLATYYPLTRSVSFDPSKNEQFLFEPIIQTGQDSWATKHLEGDLSIEPGRDRKGPITIGGVISDKKASPLEALLNQDNPDKNEFRLVVIGDAGFGTNNHVRAMGNGDIFQNVVSWLAEEEDLVSIRPQEVVTSTLVLSPDQINMILYVSVLIIPSGVLMIGLFVWRGRRQL